MEGENAMEKHVELLAPAGSFESFKAAINAGADAIYLGGNHFGARAYADNFDENELLEAMDFAHIRGKKVYMTVNTLLKDHELTDELGNYLTPFYENGLDAVIVQDFGVFEFVQKNFPLMDIHASTQMNVTGLMGAKLLKEMGASRIVPARELSLKELKEIDDNVDIEIETFVHGALCYGYSGQCLLSSMHGDRSGNRGRCAQPCRMPYGGRYPLSLKDMCTISILPDIIEAGVDSLKIEGRMKSSEYVATVVSIYRKYLDKCLSGKKCVLSNEDKMALLDIYNRGGFSQGYYSGGKGKEMIAINRPNHQGTRGLKVLSQKGQNALCKALEDVNAKDVFEIDKDFNYTLGKGAKEGENVELHLPKNYRLKEGTVIYRTRNESLLLKVKSQYIDKDSRVGIKGKVSLKVGSEAEITLICGDVKVTGIGAMVLEAKNQPLSEEAIKSKLTKTEGTGFYFSDIEVNISGNVFMPIGQLNELRRNAICDLRTAICDKYRREKTKDIILPDRLEKIKDDEPGARLQIYCQFDYATMDMDVINAALNQECVDGIYLEEEAFENVASLEKTIDMIKKSGKKAFVALPHVMRRKTRMRLQKEWGLWDKKNVDGWLVHNIESAYFLREMFGENVPLVLDFGVYTLNGVARWRLKREFPGIIKDTANVELTKRELLKLGVQSSELIVYGHLTAMLAENCVHSTIKGCDKGFNTEIINGPKGKKSFVMSRCKDCYTVTYDNRCLWLMDDVESLKDLCPKSIRLIFTNENSKIVKDVISCAKLYANGNPKDAIVLDVHKGHFEYGSGVK